jgi:alpha-N-arabinofuranosidase
MSNRVVLNLDVRGQKISRHIYGHFSEHLGHSIYGGLYVGPESGIPNKDGLRLDMIEALRRIRIPNLRWPGGCFADEYHWLDGIGPKEARPRMINTHWGGVVENNHFGSHEFLTLCDLLDCEPYICGNLGSGSVREMSQWIEYLTFDGDSPLTEERRRNGRDKPWKVRFWGIGNENWGCGGNMTAEFYADQVRRYATYCRNYGGNTLYKIAGGPNADDYRWMDILMRSLVHCDKDLPPDRHIQGISLHNYTIYKSWSEKGSALDFDDEGWYGLMERAWRMDELLTRHSSIMDSYDHKRIIGLVVDEWGTWHQVERGTNPGFLYQQNTLRDALVASLHFDIFHKHAERVRIANLAQTVNVLQSVILTEQEKMVLTPTYHVFEMNKDHQDAEALPLFVELDESAEIEVEGRSLQTFSVSASRAAMGGCTLSMTNLDIASPREVMVDLRGGRITKVCGRVLTASALNAHNTFDRPDQVTPQPFTDHRITGQVLNLTVPPHAFVVLELS